MFNTFAANEKYTHHSVHAIQPYIGTTADIRLALGQK